MTAIGVIFAALFGLALGSFLNVCISRLPLHQSVVRPRSRCPHCTAPIAGYDNIPLLSWALLRGRCRHCGEPISLRYPLVEAAVGALFVACFLLYGYGLRAGGAAVFCWLLVGLCATDAETLRVPDAFTLPGLALGLVYHGARAGVVDAGGWLGAGRAVLYAAIAAGLGALLLLLIRWSYYALRRRTGLGMGDVKLLAMIGAWLGIERTALVFFLGILLGAAYAIYLLTHLRGQARETPLPFGSFLCAAALYALFFGRATVAWYLHSFL